MHQLGRVFFFFFLSLVKDISKNSANTFSQRCFALQHIRQSQIAFLHHPISSSKSYMESLVCLKTIMCMMFQWKKSGLHSGSFLWRARSLSQAEPLQLRVEESLKPDASLGLSGVTRVILKAVGKHQLHIIDVLHCKTRKCESEK